MTRTDGPPEERCPSCKSVSKDQAWKGPIDGIICPDPWHTQGERGEQEGLRRWTLRGGEIMPRHISGSGYGPPEPITSVDGPRLAVREKVEVVEASLLTASEERVREAREQTEQAQDAANQYEADAGKAEARLAEAEEVLRELADAETPPERVAAKARARSFLSGEQG